MLTGLKSAAAETARRTVFGIAGGIALLIGILFLTIAAWIALVNVADELTAAIVLGIAYLGLGAIFLAFAMARRHRDIAPPVSHSAATQTVQDGNVFRGMAAAFFEGIGAGLTARDQFSRSPSPQERNGSDRS